jgi:serine/threonine protein phosphatase PrpC
MPCPPEMEQKTGLHWQIGQATHAGCVRGRNEDAILALHFLLMQRDEAPFPLGLFLLADGAGGHLQGQQASGLACRQAAAHLLRRILLPLLDGTDEHTQRAPINDVLESSVSVAHETIARRLPEAATTLTMALALGNGVYIAHVGDSRAYLGSQGRLECLTKDHSMAARLEEMGQQAAEGLDSQRHMLYRALGRGGAQIEPDMLYHGFEQGNYLLLCCDGLWGQVSDEEMSAIVDAAATPDAACQQLVARALEAGGEDNISVLIAARAWPPARRPASI